MLESEDNRDKFLKALEKICSDSFVANKLRIIGSYDNHMDWPNLELQFMENWNPYHIFCNFLNICLM